MDTELIKNNKYLIIGVILLLIASFGYAKHQSNRADKAEVNLPNEAGKIISMEFAESTSLRVMVVSGELVVTANDTGFAGLIPTSQKRQLPYSVDYHIDLRGVGKEKYRWDASKRTMIVEIPDVSVSRPNIDESKSVGDTPDGVFVSRGASARLQQKVAARATGFAAAEAKKPDNLNKARRSARDKVQKIIRAPLAAAGLGHIVVVTRFPWESGEAADRWDESTPLSEIVK